MYTYLNYMLCHKSKYISYFIQPSVSIIFVFDLFFSSYSGN